MRRGDKEILKRFDRFNLTETYERLSEMDSETLKTIWDKCPWPEQPEARELVRAVLLMASKRALGRERAQTMRT